MSKKTKAIKRLLSLPKGYTFIEAEALLKCLGFKRNNKGKTSGSRFCFYRYSDNAVILLHRPHPGDVMDPAAVKSLKDALERRGDLRLEE